LSKEVIEADFTFVNGQLVPGVQVAIAGGMIEDVGRLGLRPNRRFDRCALLPGFVNAHSHAFQRGLRGQGETFPSGGGSFWTWREAMYGLVESLDADGFYELTRTAYREMRRAGITTVGEFHYLHHADAGRDYALDRAVVAAARDAGIRQVVLSAYYRAGGFGLSLEGAQRRFETASPEEYWQQIDRLASEIQGQAQSIGAVVHSLRAASLEDLTAIHAEARRRGLVFHIHVEEQRAEVEACLEAYGTTPMAAILEAAEVDASFTAVHCTHTTAADMRQYLAAGGRVCVCPTTEANLGDGLPEAASMFEQPSTLCLGTDSNVRIAPVEEMRWLEYGQRLRHEARGMVAGDDGAVAPALFDVATAGGAASLGVAGGRIEAARVADFVVLDLDHPLLSGAREDTVLAAWITGGDERCIVATAVAGVWESATGQLVQTPDPG
jgi:formiminoglutamate deiminase